MMNSVAKSFAADVVRNNICMGRLDLEAYKRKCDLCHSELADTQAELDKALSEPNDLAFYQEKPVALALAVVAVALSIFVARGK